MIVQANKNKGKECAFMYIKSEKEAGACIQNGVPCKMLLGCCSIKEQKNRNHQTTFPSLCISCRIGFECGRGMCFRYQSEYAK